MDPVKPTKSTTPTKANEPVTESDVKDKKVMKKFPENKNNKRSLFVGLATVVVVLSGVGTGYALAGNGDSASQGVKVADETKDASGEVTEAGIEDEAAFPDTAEGELVTGGIDGEGTHYLERNAGENKRVYLTSTVVDLEGFSGKKVKVWGETIAAQNAPWLMDVGRIKTIE